jgi:hypothetical protein
MTKKRPITAFQGVFEEKLQRMKDSLKQEYKKAKTERRKDWLKSQIKEAKGLRNTLREMTDEKSCPHCGGKL